MKRENLRVFLFGLIITTGAILVVQTGHAESIKKAILGKWNIIGSRETIEFFEDGTIIIDSKKGSLVGDYRFLDENRIRIDLSGIGTMAGSQVARISKVNNRLTLDKLFDQKIELKKITEALQIYLDGLALYEKKKFSEAADLVEKAAKLGEAEAQNLLAYMYYNGTGIEKNYQSAFKWSLQAANQGVVPSQRLVGYMYQKGHGTEKNIEKSISWFEKAAEQNDLISLSGLAWIYATSADPKYRDGDKALKYAQMAYSQNTDKWYIFSSLAAAYARIGQFAEAENNCNRAMRLLSWDNSLSKEQREKNLQEAEILLGLYQSGQAYDESYDLDEAIAKRKEELEKAEAERKKIEEEARKKKQQEYEKRLAQQEKRRKELEEQRKKELEQKKQKEQRIATLKSEYMKPTKTLSTFELAGTNNTKVKGEIKDTEMRWMTRYRSEQQWKEKSLWFGKISNVQIIDRTAPRHGHLSKNPCFSLQINGQNVICGDDGEIHQLYYELINAISQWYDKYAEVNPKKPGFLSKISSVRAEEEARKERLTRLSNAFSGKWVGTYNCSRKTKGITGLTLNISTNSTAMRATFNFYPSQQNPNAKSGSFYLSGRFSEDGSFILQPEAWIKRPKGYRMIGMSGKINNELNKLESKNRSKCSFQLVKE